MSQCLIFLYCCGLNVTAVVGLNGIHESLKHLFFFLLASSLDSLAANVKVILEVAFVKCSISNYPKSHVVASPIGSGSA